jgi:hypothetical protein
LFVNVPFNDPESASLRVSHAATTMQDAALK